MKLLFVTPAYKPAYIYGGPTVSVSELAEALVSIGHDVIVYTTTANGKEELQVDRGKRQSVNGVTVFYFSRLTGDHTHVSPALWWKVIKTAKDFDLVHLQSWWSFLILGVAQVCKWKRQKFVLSPRGMLGAYSFQNQHSSIKKLLHRFVGKQLLKSSILHATTSLEWRDCTAVNPGWKGFITHNLINLPKLKHHLKIDDPTEFRIGFLSRIDPKKGLESLLTAVADLPFPYRLKIAGSGQETYLNNLRSVANELAISERVDWCGWLIGEDKFQFLQTIDLFVLPSHNENFAIVVTEALAMGTPVLVSENVGLSDYVRERQLGWVCSAGAETIRASLVNIFNNRSERARINRLAPDIIAEDFNKEKLAQQYAVSYREIIAG